MRISIHFCSNGRKIFLRPVLDVTFQGASNGAVYFGVRLLVSEIIFYFFSIKEIKSRKNCFIEKRIVTSLAKLCSFECIFQKYFWVRGWCSHHVSHFRKKSKVGHMVTISPPHSKILLKNAFERARLRKRRNNSLFNEKKKSVRFSICFLFFKIKGMCLGLSKHDSVFGSFSFNKYTDQSIFLSFPEKDPVRLYIRPRQATQN